MFAGKNVIYFVGNIVNYEFDRVQVSLCPHFVPRMQAPPNNLGTKHRVPGIKQEIVDHYCKDESKRILYNDIL